MMSVDKFIKEQIGTVNDEFLLEAADKELDFDTPVFYVIERETIMDKIKKAMTAAACIALAVAAVTTFLYIQGSFTDPYDSTNPADSTPDTKEEETTLFDLELTEEEIAFIEDITEKDFETLTVEDLARYKNIAIVGNHAILDDHYYYTAHFIEEYYYFEDTKCPIGIDYSEQIYLLKYFPELTGVHIYFCPNLTDLSFLSDIPNLESLTLDLVNVEDLSVLKNHPNMKNINVDHTPVSKLELHPDASLQSVFFYGAFFGDLSVFKNQKQIEHLQFYENAVPITNTEILKDFHSLWTITLVAPECDYSFFQYIKYRIPNIEIGGYDNIDLSPLENVLYYRVSFRLRFSDGCDLTILDNLAPDSVIWLTNSTPGVRGEKTAPDSEYLTDQGDVDFHDDYVEIIKKYFNIEFPVSY